MVGLRESELVVGFPLAFDVQAFFPLYYEALSMNVERTADCEGILGVYFVRTPYA